MAKKKGYTKDDYKKIVTCKKGKKEALDEEKWNIQFPATFPGTSSGRFQNIIKFDIGFLSPQNDICFLK